MGVLNARSKNRHDRERSVSRPFTHAVCTFHARPQLTNFWLAIHGYCWRTLSRLLELGLARLSDYSAPAMATAVSRCRGKPHQAFLLHGKAATGTPKVTSCLDNFSFVPCSPWWQSKETRRLVLLSFRMKAHVRNLLCITANALRYVRYVGTYVL